MEIPQNNLNKKVAIKKLIIVCLVSSVVVAAIVLGAILYLRPITVKSSIRPAAQTAQVSVSKNGINPQFLKVNVGTIVTWTSQDDELHKISADPFPKNDSFGLSSSVLMKRGSTTSFVFDQKGTFTYHDDLMPLEIKGTVIVE